jgi:hypothetical protein
MPVTDVVADAVLGRRLLDVAADRRAVGKGLGGVPGPEVVAEGEHVRVGADPGVAEQVPRAPDPVAALEHEVALVRALPGEVTGRPDSRDAGAHDEHVDMFDRH